MSKVACVPTYQTCGNFSHVYALQLLSPVPYTANQALTICLTKHPQSEIKPRPNSDLPPCKPDTSVRVSLNIICNNNKNEFPDTFTQLKHIPASGNPSHARPHLHFQMPTPFQSGLALGLQHTHTQPSPPFSDSQAISQYPWRSPST